MFHWQLLLLLVLPEEVLLPEVVLPEVVLLLPEVAAPLCRRYLHRTHRSTSR